MTIGERIKALRKQVGLTQKELADKCGYSSLTTINKIELGINTVPLSTIEKIAKVFNVTPSYLLGWNNNAQQQSRGVKIPVLGTIPAGIPIEAVEDICDYEEISDELSRTGEFFALKVRGDSMVPTIHDGDVVIIKQADDAETGKICVLMINGFDATLKEIKKDTQGIWILPHNPNSDFKPTFYSNEDIEKLPIKIIGVAVEIRRAL